ncbi:hypothetical protein GJ496_001299 [Pomphorhynchus laevis]|nr:hypothetical protein GJ496_001299 [Pomphorhynchus laevis]
MFNTLAKVGAGLALLGGTVTNMLYNVDGGHRAIIFDRFKGVKQDVIGEGTHFMIPWLHMPIIFDIRTRPRSVASATGSKDLQTVNITLRLLYRPQASSLPNIYTNLGLDYEDRVLPSITNEVLKAVVAQFDAGELITQRSIVSQRVNELLTKRAMQFGLILDDISITHLTFGHEFTAAVEAKQVAQQEAEKARFLVEKAEQYKKAAIIAAEGDTKAAELIAKALAETSEGFVELRRIEASENIASQLSRSRGIAYLPKGQSMLINAGASTNTITVYGMSEHTQDNSAWNIAEKALQSLLDRCSTGILQRCVEGRDNGLLDNMISELDQVSSLSRHKDSLKEQNRSLAGDNLSFEPLLNEGKSRLHILHEEATRLSEEYDKLKLQYEEMSASRSPTMTWVLLKSSSSELDHETEVEVDKFFAAERTTEDIKSFIDDILEKRKQVHMMKIQSEKLENYIKDPKVNLGFSLI